MCVPYFIKKKVLGTHIYTVTWGSIFRKFSDPKVSNYFFYISDRKCMNCLFHLESWNGCFGFSTMWNLFHEKKSFFFLFFDIKKLALLNKHSLTSNHKEDIVSVQLLPEKCWTAKPNQGNTEHPSARLTIEGDVFVCN